jgi:hypothetical protein
MYAQIKEKPELLLELQDVFYEHENHAKLAAANEAATAAMAESQ